MKVDNKIYLKDNNWKFNKSVAKNFTSHISKSVPLYSEVHELILFFSDFFLNDSSTCYELGCSIGHLTKKIALRHKNKKLKIYGIDNEKSMIEIAKKQSKKFSNILFLEKDISKISLKKNDFTISYYTIQFIKKDLRQNIINNIYNSLNEGGGFIFYEKTLMSNSVFQNLFSQVYIDFKSANGFTNEEIINKSKSLKSSLIPNTTKENIALLKNAGFKKISQISKFISFEGYIAIK